MTASSDGGQSKHPIRFERWHDGTEPTLLMWPPWGTQVVVATGTMVHHVETRAIDSGAEVFGSYERKTT